MTPPVPPTPPLPPVGGVVPPPHGGGGVIVPLGWGPWKRNGMARAVSPVIIGSQAPSRRLVTRRKGKGLQFYSFTLEYVISVAASRRFKNHQELPGYPRMPD